MRVVGIVSLALWLGGCGLTRAGRAEPATIDPVPGDQMDLADRGADESSGGGGTQLASEAPTMAASSFAAVAGAQAKAQSSPVTPRQTRDRVVVTGSVNVITDDVAGVVAAIRTRTAELGGTVARENIDGDPQHAGATLQLRLLPDTVSPFLDWLVTRATLGSRQLQSSEVTRQWFERDLAIKNLEITMDRLQELAKRSNAALKDVVEIEREMTRVRGELERLRGAQRLLDDQVARATLTVGVSMKRGVHVEPELKFELVPHLSLLHIVDSQFREANRTGAGVTMMFSRWFSLDFEVFPRKMLDPRSYLFTAATGLYSDFLGGGRRRFLNPYLGFRVGGAKLDGFGAFAYGADVGLELVRYRLFLLEVTGRAVGLWYRRDTSPTSDILLQGTVGIGVPF
jgi:hypothetical protein